MKLMIGNSINNRVCPSSFRPTLYVGKLDSHLYASTALVHQGVSLVVRISRLLYQCTSGLVWLSRDCKAALCCHGSLGD